MSIRCVKVAICPETGEESDAVIAKWGRRDGESDFARLQPRRRKRRSFMARCLLRGTLENLTGASGSEWSFTTDINGKPFAIHPSGIPAPAVSISHSDTIVVAAATVMNAIGIDVERHRFDRPLADMARIAFGPKEQIEALEAPGAFYKIWTLREAMAKATGAGLTQVTDGKDKVHGAPPFGAWETGDAPHRWRLAHVEAAPGYSLAIALNGGTSESSLHWSMGSIEWLAPDSGGSIRHVPRLATVITGNEPAKIF